MLGQTVAAVLVFGDTRHTAGQPYNVETGADKDSGFPRSGTDLEKMATYASVLRSYCVATDPVCAGGEDHSTHLDYFQKFTDDAGIWVRSMVGIENNGTASTTATVTSSSRAASDIPSAVASATSTSSGLHSIITETGASTTATATGSATATGTSDNGAATLSRGKGLAWMGVMIGLCLLAGQ